MVMWFSQDISSTYKNGWINTLTKGMDGVTVVEKIGFKPETGLRGLNRRIRALLSVSTVIQSETGRSGVLSDLLTYYRQTAIAELFHDKYIIAIAGMQGVGKTTLLKQLYDIPSGYIPENIGRGEKLPILVTEHPVEEIHTYVRRAEPVAGSYDFELREVAIPGSQFMEISRQPGEHDMWLELKVPYRYFYSSDKSFALLPGIEDVEERDQEWQEFVRHALTLAATCIMVFDRAKLAQGQNRALLESVVRDFKTAKPIFTLSSSDERSPEDNAQLKGVILEHFGIPVHESDRVVLKGTGEEFGNGWIEELMDAVCKYAAIPREFRRNQVNHIDRLVTSFTTVLAKLQTELDRYDLRSEGEEEQDYRKHLQFYDQAVRSLRISVERALNQLLTSHQSTAVREIQDLIASKGGITKVKEFILGKSYQGHLEFTRRVQDAWEKPRVEQNNDIPSSLAEDKESGERFYIGLKCARRFHMLISDYLRDFSVKPTRTNRLLASKEEREAAAKQENTAELVVRQDIIDNLNGFFSDELANDKKSNELMEESVKLIPIIAMERLAESLVLSQMAVENRNGRMLVERPSVELAEQLEKVKFPPGSIVRAAALVFGVDAVDGTINTVPALLTALGIPATATSVSVAVSLCGLLSLGFVAASVCRQITKQDFQDEDAAITLIRQFKESYQQAVMDHFDDLMAEAKKRLEHRLRLRLHKNESFIRWERLRYTLRDVQHYQIELQRNIHEGLGFLG
jgi:hypothetical protein